MLLGLCPPSRRCELLAYNLDCHISLAAPAQKGQQESPWPGDVACRVACLSSCSASFVMPPPPPNWRPESVRPESEEFRRQLKQWKTNMPVAVVAWGQERWTYATKEGGQHT